MELVKIEPGCLKVEEGTECWGVGVVEFVEEDLRHGHQHNKPANTTANVTTTTCFRFRFLGCGSTTAMNWFSSDNDM